VQEHQHKTLKAISEAVQRSLPKHRDRRGNICLDLFEVNQSTYYACDRLSLCPHGIVTIHAIIART
jgi:hypothetical protein